MLAQMKERYSVDFKAALNTALAAIDPESRNDLRLYYFDGVKLEDLARLHEVATSTMSRRLARTRKTVLARTREILRAQLGVDEAELDSILHLIESRLDMSAGALGARES